jgi:two-component system chemotaxis sensor kinase CheA
MRNSEYAAITPSLVLFRIPHWPFRMVRSMKPDRSIKDFLGEAEDILETANQALVSLESEQAAGRPNPETVNALFRAVHSFKGLAGVFGLTAPSDLTHKMESLLDELRLGKIGFTREVLDLLFETTALLGRLVSQVAKKQQFEDINAAVDRIDHALRSRPFAAADRSLLDRIEIDPGILGVLTEYEEHRLRENIRERANLFVIKVAFQLADFEKGIKRLSDEVKKRGEVICILPTAGAEAGGIGFTLLVGAAADREDIETAVTLPDATIQPVTYREAARAEAPRLEAGAIKSVSNTVRVDIYRLDSLMNSVGELHLTKNVIGRLVKELRSVQGFTGIAVSLHKAHRNLERKLNELQEGILSVRMVPLSQIFLRLSQAVRKYAKDAGKEIDLQLQGEETELDKLMIEDLADPLMHLIRNAVDHGIEPPDVRERLGKPGQGTVRLTAFPKGNHVVITVEDDGAGIPAPVILAKAVEKGLLPAEHGLDPAADQKEILDLIFLPGFTTREQVTEISGRGVGMDVVKKNISKLSGMIDIETEPGQGTKFSLTLPITLAIIKALIIEAGGQVFAVPLSSVLEIVQAAAGRIETVETREVMAIRGDTVPLLRLAKAFNLPEGATREALYVILVGLAERRLGIVVDALRDQQEIVIKPISKRFAEIPGVAGATELGDKRGVVLVLDVESLVEGAFKKTVISRQ